MKKGVWNRVLRVNLQEAAENGPTHAEGGRG